MKPRRETRSIPIKSPTDGKPAGVQTIGVELYQQIRQVVAELSVRASH